MISATLLACSLSIGMGYYQQPGKEVRVVVCHSIESEPHRFNFPNRVLRERCWVRIYDANGKFIIGGKVVGPDPVFRAGELFFDWRFGDQILNVRQCGYADFRPFEMP